MIWGTWTNFLEGDEQYGSWYKKDEQRYLVQWNRQERRKKLIGSDNNLNAATSKTRPEPHVNTFNEKVAGEQMKQWIRNPTWIKAWMQFAC